jgi:hypothetical protein
MRMLASIHSFVGMISVFDIVCSDVCYNRYVMVDPWKHWPTLEYLDAANRLQTEQDDSYKYVQTTTMALDNNAASRAAILRLTSDQAADLIPDSSLVSA